VTLLWEARTAARGLLRRPALAATAVLVLGLGIGASTAVFSAVHGVLLHPLPFPEQERLLVVYKNDVVRGYSHWPLRYPELEEWVRGRPSFESASVFSSYGGWTATLAEEGGAARTVSALPVSSGFFDVLGVGAVLGRTFTPDDDRGSETPAIVLSHRFWRETFAASPDVVGRSIRLLIGSRERFRITGVLPPGIEYPGDRATMPSRAARGIDVYIAALAMNPTWEEDRGFECNALVRLGPGATREGARAELAAALAQRITEQPENYDAAEVVALPILASVVGDTGRILLLLLGAVAVVLAIAALNVAALLLVRGLERERETAIRMALGAGRVRLIRHQLWEAALLAALGAVLGIALARIGLSAVLRLAPAEALPRAEEIGLNPTVLAFALAVAAAAALSTVLFTGWQATRSRIAHALRRGPGRLPGRRALSGLVVCELALAFAVAAGALLFSRDLAARMSVDRGFDSGRLVMASLGLPDQRYEGEALLALTDRLMERVEALPGVESAVTVSLEPATRSFGTGAPLMREGQSDAEAASNPIAAFEGAHPAYFRTLGIPIVEGRGFTDDDRGSANRIAVVNESLARALWPGQSPLGRRVRVRGASMPWLTVVGVASDARYRELEKQWPAIYWPAGQNSFGDEPGPGWYTPGWLAIRSPLGARELAGPVRGIAHQLDPEIRIEEVLSVDAILDAELVRPRFQTTLLGLFGLAAVALAAVGLYGVLAANGRRRTPEIGIRLALGASRRRAVEPLLRETALLSGLGLTLGATAALALRRTVETLLYGVPSLDPVSFVSAGALLAGVVCGAAAGPLRRAARTDCASTLRGE
jgi:predicted permease